jgi:eukaryotic-like serine/threonine-protein kinase
VLRASFRAFPCDWPNALEFEPPLTGIAVAVMQPSIDRGGISIHPGTRLGPYEILASIGAGAMGQVYRARDTRLDRFVAIKVLAPSASSVAERRLDRLQREARAISRVSHPHICALYDVGQQDGLTFLVMEHLAGETLARLLDKGPVPLRRALVIGIEIADALDAAHRRGVIHRDLKPGNVMLTADGVKLLDFGLAKMREADAERPDAEATRSLALTEEGAILGTYPYMSPEQVEGRSADARSDIFALGVVLYEMVTGRRAFEAESRAALAAAILTHDAPPVSTLCPSAPPLLDKVVARCLAKDPDARWQTARDLAAELQWISEGSFDSRDREKRQSERNLSGRWARLAWMAVGPLVGMLVAAVAFWGLSARGLVGSRAPIPRFTQVTFRAGTVSAARFAPDGETIIYSAAWQAQAHGLFMSRTGSAESRPLGIANARLLGVSSTGDLTFLRGSQLVLKFGGGIPGTLERVSLTGGAPREILEGVRAADWIPGTAELAVARGDGQVEFPIGTKIYKPPAGGIRALRVSPRGDRVALLENTNLLWSVIVVDRAGKKTTLSTGWTESNGLAWSPDGSEVWFSATRDFEGPTLWAVSMSGKSRVLVSTPPAPHVIEDVFRDGRMLVTIHDWRVGVSCLPPGETTPRELGWLDFSGPEALSADGRTIVFSDRPTGQQRTSYLRRTDGSDAVRLGDGFPEDLSPDGKSVLVAFRRGGVRLGILPTGAGSPRQLPPGSLDAIGEANFLPDGRAIAFAGREKGRSFRIYVQDLQGGAPRAISPEGVWTNALATPDGRFVWGRPLGRGGIAGTPTTYVLYPVDEGPPRALPFETFGEPLQWSPDGRFLYMYRGGSWPPVVDRVEVATGKRDAWRTVFPADPVGVENIARILITPDGKSYCHDYLRLLSKLFIVDGVQ